MSSKKDRAAIEDLKKYINTIPQKEKDKIRRELERDELSTQEAIKELRSYEFKTLTYKNAPWETSGTISKNSVVYYQPNPQQIRFVSGQWDDLPNNPVEEDVQDVSFE